MERLQAQSISWRLYAATVVLLLLIAVQRRPIIPGAGLNWEGAKAVYWSFGILGLVGHAYGFRFLSQTFWRAYALLFVADITIRFTAKFGWVPVARLFGYPDGSRHSTLIILLGFGLIAATCVALLRYGGWLKAPPVASSIAEHESGTELSEKIERAWSKPDCSSRYSLADCALASLAGAAGSAVLTRIWIGNWSVGFAALEFVVAFLTLACGGRALANRLAAEGKDIVLRGTVIGLAIGALVAASIAILLAGALLGGSLFTSPASLALMALMGAPFGAVDGAMVGCVLILLGRRKPSTAT